MSRPSAGTATKVREHQGACLRVVVEVVCAGFGVRQSEETTNSLFWWTYFAVTWCLK